MNRAARFYREEESLRALVRRLAQRPGGRLLDVGCKKGDVTAGLTRGAAWVIGLDPLLFPEWRRSPSGACFLQADGRRTPFADAAFDVVVASECLMYMAPTVEALSEFHRILKPRGILVLSFPEDGPLTCGLDPYNLALRLRRLRGGAAGGRPFARHIRAAQLLENADGWRLEVHERRGSLLFIHLAWLIDKLQVRADASAPLWRRVAATLIDPLLALLCAAMRLDFAIGWGPLSYNNVMRLRKTSP